MSKARHLELLARFSRLVAADGYAHGLQPVQWQALQFLARANRFSRTPKGLTAWLGQTKGSVSQTIIALEAKGLVARTADSSDRRVVRLELTPAGCQLLEDLPPPVGAQMLEHLDDDDGDRLIALVEAMLLRHLAGTGQQPFGQCQTCRHFATLADGRHRCALLDVELAPAEAEQICIEQEAA